MAPRFPPLLDSRTLPYGGSQADRTGAENALESNIVELPTREEHMSEDLRQKIIDIICKESGRRQMDTPFGLRHLRAPQKAGHQRHRPRPEQNELAELWRRVGG
jgi:hypothetical protein